MILARIILGFMLLTALDTMAQICFKLASTHALPLAANWAWVQRVLSHIWLYGAILGYIGSFFTWTTLLKRVAVGPAFAASHLQIISVMVVSWWLFNEPVSPAKIAGSILILSGIACLAFAQQQRENVAAAVTTKTTPDTGA